MKFIKKSDEFLKNLSTLKFIITIAFCTFLVSLAFGCLVSILNAPISDTDVAISNSSLIEAFIVAVIIAPLIETLIFQYAIIKYLRKLNILKNRNLIIILISAILFGLAHTYNLQYVIHTFFIGILLAYSFVVYEKKESSPFWTVCAIHSLRNLTIFSLLSIIG
ncbi:type II CAAX prenyl endopeptidase Rce1 family protein [Clostridium estertheticum]|uniref:CPBP family glutamic-type intramembrane protease n=1 Tax=Clostridium estertheticum TaxID=238834 RepID=UPI001CF53F16|nr:CPBP family glutamic-type intramembrane protease [Clostridium estertheticum]MCB2361671.1 CPBP family intramembrane metalloprotease [Clostridium estertheticum]